MTTQPPNYYYRPPSRRPAPPPPKKRRWPLFILLAFLVAGGYYSLRLFGGDIHFGRNAASAKVAAAPKPTLNAAQVSTLASQIDSTINQYPDMDIGVSIEDLNNDARYHYGISNPFIAASESKI